MPRLNLIGQASTQPLTIALLHFLGQGALFALAAAVASPLLRRASANATYGVHVVALAAMLVCIAVTFAWVSIDARPSTAVSTDAVTRAAGANHSERAGFPTDVAAVDAADSAESRDAFPVPPSTGDKRPTPPSLTAAAEETAPPSVSAPPG